MDIKEYIASGIIDSYVLGAVSSQEQQEVQCLSKIYPEIKEELLRAEKTLEGYANSIAVNPPKELKEAIMNKIRSTTQESYNDSAGEAPQQSKIVQIPAVYKWSVAASIIVIIGLGFLYMNSYSDVNELQSQVATLTEEADKDKQSLESAMSDLQATLFEVQEREAFISAPNTKKLLLAGTESQPEASATFYWDENTGEAILASNGLPTPQNGKQFQLWAIADGVPVDLGVLDKDSVYSSKINVNLNNISAFAITLEKEGGSPTPTLEQMYVIGGV